MKSQRERQQIWKQSSDVKIDSYLQSIVLHWIVINEVIKMNEMTERKDNKYICKQSSDVKLD